MAREIDLSKPLDQVTIEYLRSTRPLGTVERMIEIAGVVSEPSEALFNPDQHTVAEVLEYLLTATGEETERILDAEEAGRGRRGILAEHGR